MQEFNLLGKSNSRLPASPEEAQLDTFPNRNTEGNYVIHFDCLDFTSLCPVTSQPDYARITIRYIPDKICVETKSLKFYLQSYRNVQAFNEEVVNRICKDLASVCEPKWLQVEGAFVARGGIALTTTAEYPDPGIDALIQKFR